MLPSPYPHAADPVVKPCPMTDLDHADGGCSALETRNRGGSTPDTGTCTGPTLETVATTDPAYASGTAARVGVAATSTRPADGVGARVWGVPAIEN